MNKFEMALDSILCMTNINEDTNDKYKEILVLDEMLKEAYIPHTMEPMFGGYHICYPTKENTVCSAIEHSGSYGRNEDKIEIMGLLTDEEQSFDDVVGGLSAKEVFERIKKHYKESEVAHAD